MEKFVIVYYFFYIIDDYFEENLESGFFISLIFNRDIYLGFCGKFDYSLSGEVIVFIFIIEFGLLGVRG